MLDEELAPRGLERARSCCAARGSGACRRGEPPPRARRASKPVRRASAAARSLGGQTRVARNPARGRLVEGAHGGRVQRVAAAVAQRELPRAADLLGQRAARDVRRRRERPEPDAAAPQHERDEREREHHDGRAVLPEQREQRRVIVFREEVHVVTAPHLRWRPRTAGRDRRRTGAGRGTASR